MADHQDTTGDYSEALTSLIAGGGAEHDLSITSQATTAAKHPWLNKFVPALEKLAVTHHVGNNVATARGPNPPTQFESMPIYVRLGMHLLYVGKEQEKLLGSSKINALLKEQSIKQGRQYDASEGALAHIQSFIKTYNIDCNDLLQQNLADYPNFNAFFSRALQPNARPIASPEDPIVISSVADCRLTVFQSIALAQEFWIKGKAFTVGALLGDESLAKSFEGGEIAIFRLAPADYHRWHTPVTATVGPTKHIEGDYYTVNPCAINEDLDVFTKNRRDVTILSMDSQGSTPVDVAVVAVGAMLVGSIIQTKEQGSTVHRGEELGYFAYGGSTVILVFPPGKVEWDNDLVVNSKVPIETAVRVGDRIGRFI